MIWNNGIFCAPLQCFQHPFFTTFYNVGYDTEIRLIGTNKDKEEAQYHPYVWGYFSKMHFVGDFTNFGSEIQISDYWMTVQKRRRQIWWVLEGYTCVTAISATASRIGETCSIWWTHWCSATLITYWKLMKRTNSTRIWCTQAKKKFPQNCS